MFGGFFCDGPPKLPPSAKTTVSVTAGLARTPELRLPPGSLRR
jgi:hypothetical protein